MSYLYSLYDTINIKNSKVGVGTTVPTELLHVEGTVYLDRIYNRNSNIDMSLSTLSNVKVLQTGSLAPLPGETRINVSNTTFSNINNLLVNGDAVIDGTITTSNLRVIGDFTTLNTITSNTEQLTVTNLGTGPALRVNQSGVGSQYSVAEFYDNESGIALKIADTGLIGIGTDTPTTQLHVYDGSSNVVATLAAASTNAAQVRMSNASGITIIGPSSNGTVDFATTADQPLVFGTSNVERMRVMQGGNIGVGTTDALYALDVRGTSVGFFSPVYVKNGSMNLITTSIGNVSFTTTGSHSMGVRLTWTNVISSSLQVFRTTVKFHIASDSEVAYRTFDTFINPKNDAVNNFPSQLVYANDVNMIFTNFTNLSHTASRYDNNSVDLVISWSMAAQPALANLQLEIFANDSLGDFTFQSLST
jgi:hypothetical protein